MKLNNKDIQNYNKNGVIVLKKVFKEDEISYLQKRIELYIKKFQFKLKGKNINFIKNKINSIHKFRDPFFKKFSNQKKVKEIGDYLLKSTCKVKHFEYFAKPALVGMASPMHQDNYYWNLINPNALTIWIAIDSANKKNGSVDYLLKSHKKLYKHEDSFMQGSSQKLTDIKKIKKKFRMKSFNLKPGDCLIHHSQIVHGSKKNISKFNRRGFTIQLMPTSSKIDKKKFNQYQKSLSKQIKLRNNLQN